jgi:hypothetical protein
MFEFLSTYPEVDIYKMVLKRYSKERISYYKTFNFFINQNKSSWTGYMVANRPFYFSNLNKTPILRDFIRHEFYWEGIDTNNPKLINSPLYGSHIDAYLTNADLIRYSPFSVEDKQHELKKSTDVILKIFSKNEQTKQFAKGYLVNKFRLEKNDELLEYVLKN